MPPGCAKRPHRHIGFVFGHLLEGDLHFRIGGGEETISHAGQMFCAKPGAAFVTLWLMVVAQAIGTVYFRVRTHPAFSSIYYPVIPRSPAMRVA
jgi:hypothetical protein